MSAQFYRGQRVRETATGKLWYVTACYPRSVTVRDRQCREAAELTVIDEQVFKREELEPVEERAA